MKIKNLTPHVLNIVREDGSVWEIPSSGIIPRVEVTQCVNGEIEGCQIFCENLGTVVGLPPAEPDVLLVVSRLVASACPDRNDLLVPGELMRNEDGKVIGARGFAVIQHK